MGKYYTKMPEETGRLAEKEANRKKHRVVVVMQEGVLGEESG